MHAFDSDVVKSEDWRTYYISYIRVMEELLRICDNHTKAIDFFPRLDCYKLPQMAWNKLIDYEYGIKGLLANDRDGRSYFLSFADEEILKRDRMISIDGKTIICTSIRLEEVNDIAELEFIHYPCICFTHEWLWNKNTREKYERMIKMICYANSKIGGEYLFPEDVQSLKE